MKLTYDPEYNVAYICFKQKQTEVETIRVSNELNVDMAPDGTIYGIELLNANQQLAADDNGTLVFVNESSGHSSEIQLQQ